jgi:hypothetical protein
MARHAPGAIEAAKKTLRPSDRPYLFARADDNDNYKQGAG